MAVIKSKHTQIFIATAATEVIKVTRVRGAGFPDGSASEIDISDFDDDWDQFVAGRKATGSTTLEIIYDPRSPPTTSRNPNPTALIHWQGVADSSAC